MPRHIRRHSEQVARVARRLGEALRQFDGESVDLCLLEAAALLHDIAKASCLANHKDHAVEGGRLLRALGLPRVADLVERHVELGQWRQEGCVTEAEILNYSDKRVRHEEVVSLTDRFLDLLERYGKRAPQAEGRIRDNWQDTEAVERKIFGRLPFGPGDVV